MKNRKTLTKGVETHLFRYAHYQVAIKNLKRQLDYILPDITANYELREGSTGTFSIASSTENIAIDRIESRRAINLHEEIKHYELLLQCIDDAIHGLDAQDRAFIEARYIQGRTVAAIAEKDGYSLAHMYKIRDRILGKLLISLSAIVDI